MRTRNILTGLFLFHLLFLSPVIAATERVSAAAGYRVVSSERSNNYTRLELDLSPHPVSNQDFSQTFYRGNGPVNQNSPATNAHSNLVSSGWFRVPPHTGIRVELQQSDYSLVSGEEYQNLLDYLQLTDSIIETGNDNRWYPEAVVSAGTPVRFREFRLASLHTSPVQINPVLQQARIYSNLSMNLSFEGTDYRNDIDSQPTRISKTFLPWYRQLLDWEESELDYYELYRGGVQVILQDEEILWDTFHPWIEWKLQRGWDLEFLTDSDVEWNENAIRLELIDRYENSPTPFDYIVVIGDGTGTFLTPPGQQYGDQRYMELAGNDWFPEVALGRISVENNVQCITYVNKVLDYEKDPYRADDPDWFGRGMVVAGSSTSGSSTILVGRYCRHAMLDHGFVQVDTAWYNDGQGNVNNRSTMRINDGISYYNFRGYLGTGLSSAHIGNLQNTRKCYFAVDITCGTGNWSTAIAISETHMRAGTPVAPKGAIGAIGMATSSTHTRFNNSLAGGSAYTRFILDLPYAGDLAFGGKMNFLRNYSDVDSGIVQMNLEWFNLMGDPLVPVWSTTPQLIEAVVAESLPVGNVTLDLNVTSDGDPLEDAWVTLYKVDEQDSLIERFYTNAGGATTVSAILPNPGNAILTISKPDYLPLVDTIQVVAEDASLGFSSIQVVDDGTGGTSGDGDGIAEAGETVGMEITALNYNSSETISDIEISVESDDEWITSVSGMIAITDLSPGEEETSGSLILLEISPAAQQNWVTQIEIQFQSNLGVHTDVYELKLNAPLLTPTLYSLPDTINPATEFELSVTLYNAGYSNAAPASAQLSSQSPFISVVENQAFIGECDENNTVIAGPFTLLPLQGYVRGQYVNACLDVLTETGQVNTVPLRFSLGTRGQTDITGPDNYGYYAIENVDSISTSSAPSYEWIEISQLEEVRDYEGEYLAILDSAEDTDRSVVLDLPFSFRYYGEDFDQLTVTMNGMVALGTQPDMPLFRNWTIPSPLGPNSMIAVYWDERRNIDGDGVYYYHDEDNHRIILEWYHVKDGGWDGGDHFCTFELIIYENLPPHDTFTGDNEFLMQYQSLEHSHGDSHDNPWFTVGIENHDQTDGLLLSYWLLQTPGTSPVENGRAILFTTDPGLPIGHVSGMVVDSETQVPLEGALVQVEDSPIITLTDSAGSFLLVTAIGTVNLIAIDPNHLPTMQSDILVVEGDTAQVDFALAFGEEVTTVPEALDIYFPPGAVYTNNFSIENNGLRPLSIQLQSEFVAQDSIDDPETWSLHQSFPLGTDDPDHYGFVINGTTIWMCGSDEASGEDVNKLYKYSRSFELEQSYELTIPGIIDEGITSLARSGDTLFGSHVSDLYIFHISDETPVLVDQVALPLGLGRFSCYSEPENLFYMSRANSDFIYTIDRQGNVLESFRLEGYVIHSLSWNENLFDGYPLLAFCLNVAGDFYRLIRINPETEEWSICLELIPDSTFTTPHDLQFSTSWDRRYHSLLVLHDGEEQDSIGFYNVATQYDWFDISPIELDIEPYSQEPVGLSVSTHGFIPGDYPFTLTIFYDHLMPPLQLPVNLTIDENASEIEPADPGPVFPETYALTSVYPVPFNSSLKVEVDLPVPSNIAVTLYNILGQSVFSRSYPSCPAGHHSIGLTVDGASSGIYFLEVNTGNHQWFRKVVYLK